MDKVRSRPRPDFICIGPKKTATTWVADQLKFHRDIWLTPIQELSVLTGGFARHVEPQNLAVRWSWWEVAKRIVRNKSLSAGADGRFYQVAHQLAARSDVDLHLYRELFTPAGARLAGDISPMYASMTAEELEHAQPVLRTAQIFMIARDPVARFWSELSMHARKRTHGDVDYGSLAFAKRFFGDPERQKQHLLSEIVARWSNAIGAERLRVFMFDDVRRDPENTLREIVRYIGADYRKRLPIIAASRNRKAQNVRLEPSAEARQWVTSSFQPELRACEDLFGEQGRAWRVRHAPGGGGGV